MALSVWHHYNLADVAAGAGCVLQQWRGRAEQRTIAGETAGEIAFVRLDSDGVVLIYGRDEAAIEAGQLLADHLDVTVLIARPDNLRPPRAIDFPVVQGTVRSAKGHLGAF